MNILLVWANRDTFTFKPLGLSLLSAILKQKGHSVELFDTTFIDCGCKGDTEIQSKIKVFKPVNFGDYDIEKKQVDLKDETIKKLKAFNPDIIAVSALFDEIDIGIEISRIAKEWNSSVVVVWVTRQ